MCILFQGYKATDLHTLTSVAQFCCAKLVYSNCFQAWCCFDCRILLDLAKLILERIYIIMHKVHNYAHNNSQVMVPYTVWCCFTPTKCTITNWDVRLPQSLYVVSTKYVFNWVRRELLIACCTISSDTFSKKVGIVWSDNDRWW